MADINREEKKGLAKQKKKKSGPAKVKKVKAPKAPKNKEKRLKAPKAPKNKEKKQAARGAKLIQKREKKAAARHKVISVRTKLILLIVPVTIGIVAVLVIVSSYMSKNRMQAMSEAQLDSSIQNQSDSITAWLEQNLEFFSTAKTTIESIQPKTADDLKAALNIYYGQNENCPNGLYVAGSDGKYFKAVKSGLAFRDITNTMWYRQGLTRVNMDYGSAYMDMAGKYVVSASALLNDGSGKLRVISADVSLDKITTIVNSGTKMNGANSFLVDTRTGTILSSPKSSMVGTNIQKSKDPLMTGVAKKLKVHDLEADTIDDRLVEMREINDTDWVLVSYAPMSLILKDVADLSRTLAILGFIAIIILVVILLVVVTGIFAPISGITKSITNMSEGDFTIKVKQVSHDEIGAMSGSVGRFVERMRGMLSSIRNESVKLKSQSESTDKVSKDMLRESTSQTKEMENLNQIVDSLAVAVNNIADSATTLAQVVSDTKEDSDKTTEAMTNTVRIAKQGQQDISNLGSAMEEIRNANQSLAESVNQVGEASNQITKIVTVIQEIADETNLLSLNASIEAARAGESGRGFAVVASQIGKLANNSGESANDISKLIRNVSDLIEEAVKKADESYQAIERNGALIDSTVQSFDEIYENINQSNRRLKRVVENIKKVEGVATNVAAISEEQAASTAEIQTTAQEIVEHARSITRSSQDVAENSKELSDTSTALAGYVSRFRI